MADVHIDSHMSTENIDDDLIDYDDDDLIDLNGSVAGSQLQDNPALEKGGSSTFPPKPEDDGALGSTTDIILASTDADTEHVEADAPGISQLLSEEAMAPGYLNIVKPEMEPVMHAAVSTDIEVGTNLSLAEEDVNIGLSNGEEQRNDATDMLQEQFEIQEDQEKDEPQVVEIVIPTEGLEAFPQNEANGEEVDEITWEEPVSQALANGVTGVEDTVEHSAAPAEQNTSAFAPKLEREADGGDEQSHQDEAVKEDEIDYVPNDEADVDAREEAQGADASTKEEKPTDGEEKQFPAITVQYKGDEFPFFSSSSEGFFADISILDEPLAKLLAGFRSELESELAHDEELIFQVDELGLEFAESSTNHTLSDVTLRQILEIFEMLVKNQDPDSSRTLYTYLFTKHSISKRFEYLSEKAANGTGLDEVIHLFESPMPQITGAADLFSIDQGLDEMLESYESLYDEDTEEVGDEEVEPANDASQEDESHQTEPETRETDEDATRDTKHIEEIELPQDEEVRAVSTTRESSEQQDQDARQPDNEAETALLISETSGQPPSAAEPTAGLENDPDAFLAAQAHDNKTAGSQAGEVATASTPTDQTPGGLPTDGARSIDDIEFDTTHAAGLDIDLIDVNPMDDVSQQDQDEIDWLEEPQQAVESFPANSPTSATKRPRPDADLAADDEQDAKRLRSEA